MKRSIYITTKGVAHDYRYSLVPLIIENLGYKIIWNHPRKVDLLIFGPFYKRVLSYKRMIPKPLRGLESIFEKLFTRKIRPLTLFQTGENVRHDFLPCDLSISFDLAISDVNHFRLPYWMEVLNWQSEGIVGNRNPRYGRLLDINRLMRPLGDSFLKKPFAAALISSHLNEPRLTLYNKLSRLLPVSGFGSYFNEDVRDHASSNFTKEKILHNYAFNLCPENGLYPGYYTEKIPEAFMSDCLPITWVDVNVAHDFNQNSILNLLSMMYLNEDSLELMFNTKDYFGRFCDEKLIVKKPTIEYLTHFISNMVTNATS